MDDDLLPECNADLENLIQQIIGDHCCLFLGSGPSRAADYPSWDQLIDKIYVLTKDLLGDDTQCDPSWEPEKKLQYYKDKIGHEPFINEILSVFDSKDKEDCRTIHRIILQIPFKAYITTNFDYCLENAGRDKIPLPQVYTFPGLDAEYIRNGNIIHIHGVIPPENPGQFSKVLVLTTQNYYAAYETVLGFGLLSLLTTLFWKSTVVFIGYSLNDSELNKVIQNTRRKLKDISEITFEKDLGRLKIPNHYIFLHETDAKDREEKIRELELIPIIYRGDNKRHMGLQRIFETIRSRVTNSNYPSMIPNREMFEDV